MVLTARRLPAAARRCLAVLATVTLAAGAAVASVPSSDAATSRLSEGIFVDTGNAAAVAAAAARTQGRLTTAANLDVIGKRPQAKWFGDWFTTAEIESKVRTYTAAATAKGQVPVMVLYAITDRDCGGASSGGLTSAGYTAWVANAAKGLAGSHAIVVLEPDAVAQMATCSSPAARGRLLASAVSTLSAQGAWVYIDAGNSNWISPEVMADRLVLSGVAGARGIATNVSSFHTTSDERAYAGKVLYYLGKRGVTGKHYVVDTSRNGRGATTEWCNPPGRGLGTSPRFVQDGSQLDGLLWVKRPGQSDGTCNGGPAAGQFSESIALSLVANRSL